MRSDKAVVLTKKAALEFDKLSNPVLLEYDLTCAQYKILKYLYAHRDEAVRQVDLEKFYSLTHPTTSGLVDNLVKKGFAVRMQNPDDARSKVITLTQRALEMQGELERLGEALEARFTAALTEKEREQLVALLQKLLTAFE